MAEALNTRVRSFLECTLCLDRFVDPKQLKCFHHFCKGCLEDVMEFNDDGSATITCPLRCEEKTIIGAHETVNDLSASYELKGLLDVFKTEYKLSEYRYPKCTFDESCAKDVSMYCCTGMFCKICYASHLKAGGEHSRSAKLSFDTRENKLNVVCEKHCSTCTHLCEDGVFLCIYCVKREENHKNHLRNTIDTDVALLKEALRNDADQATNIDQFLKVTKENIDLIKKKASDLLEKREEECLTLYKEFIKTQKEMLKVKLESICEEHIKQYPRNSTPGYHKDKLEKCNVELAIHKDEILDVIRKNKSISSLTCDTVSIRDTFDFLSEQPLCEIEVSFGEQVLIGSQPVPTITDNFKVGCEKSNESDGKHNVNHGGARRKLAVDTRNSDEKKSHVDDTSRMYLHGQCDSARESVHNTIINNPFIVKPIHTFLDITIEGTDVGRLVISMFTEVVPKTCKNFSGLCTHSYGFGFRGSKIDWVYRGDGGCCLGGTITQGDGSDGRSIYGRNFPCENHIMKHEKGIVSMWNIDDYVDSRFLITTKAQPEWDGVNVIFGKVTNETYHIVEKIMEVNTKGGKPIEDIIIRNCGVL